MTPIPCGTELASLMCRVTRPGASDDAPGAVIECACATTSSDCSAVAASSFFFELPPQPATTSTAAATTANMLFLMWLPLCRSDIPSLVAVTSRRHEAGVPSCPGSSGTSEAGFARADDCLSAICDAQLREDVRHVVAHRLRAEHEVRGD